MQDRFIRSITQLPTPLADALIPMLHQNFAGHIDAQQLATLTSASKMTEAEVLLALLPIAAALAKPPISEFYVGAIAKGKSGDIYMGANLELPGEALFHSVHAEQSAISHAWLSGESQIVDIIVNASPCGHCRQFMNELVEGRSSDLEQDQHSSTRTGKPSSGLLFTLCFWAKRLKCHFALNGQATN